MTPAEQQLVDSGSSLNLEWEDAKWARRLVSALKAPDSVVLSLLNATELRTRVGRPLTVADLVALRGEEDRGREAQRQPKVRSASQLVRVAARRQAARDAVVAGADAMLAGDLDGARRFFLEGLYGTHRITVTEERGVCCYNLAVVEWRREGNPGRLVDALRAFEATGNRHEASGVAAMVAAATSYRQLLQRILAKHPEIWEGEIDGDLAQAVTGRFGDYRETRDAADVAARAYLDRVLVVRYPDEWRR